MVGRPVSALVVLRHLDETGDPTSPITAARPHRPQAAPAVVDALTGWFRARGLETGPAVGISFAITGPSEAFAALWPGTAAFESPVDDETALPLDRLPDDVSAWVDAVVLTAPPDFGPTSP